MRTSNLLIIRSFVLSVFFISLTLMMGCGSSSEKDPGQSDPPDDDLSINIDQDVGITGTVANEKLNVSLTETTSYVHIDESGSNDNQTYDNEDSYYIEVSGDTLDGERISVGIHFYDYYTFLTNTVYSLSSEDLGDVSVGSKTYPFSSLKILFEEYSNKDGETVSGVAQVELDDEQGNVTIRFDANLYYQTFFVL